MQCKHSYAQPLLHTIFVLSACGKVDLSLMDTYTTAATMLEPNALNSVLTRNERVVVSLSSSLGASPFIDVIVGVEVVFTLSLN